MLLIHNLAPTVAEQYRLLMISNAATGLPTFELAHIIARANLGNEPEYKIKYQARKIAKDKARRRAHAKIPTFKRLLNFYTIKKGYEYELGLVCAVIYMHTHEIIKSENVASSSTQTESSAEQVEELAVELADETTDRASIEKTDSEDDIFSTGPCYVPHFDSIVELLNRKFPIADTPYENPPQPDEIISSKRDIDF